MSGIIINPYTYSIVSSGLDPDGTQYYVELTIQSSQVSSDLTNFPVYVDLSTLPSAFFSNVQLDGGDIRVTESDGSTRCPVDLVSIDTGASVGELHFLASSLSSSSDTTFRIYYGTTGTSSQPAVGATYGRNAVWADYLAVLHLEEDPSGSAPQMVDSTGNGHDGTAGGSMTSGDSVSGQLGKTLHFDGSNDVVNLADETLIESATAFTVSVWMKPDGAQVNDSGIVGDRNGQIDSSFSQLWMRNNLNNNRVSWRVDDGSSFNSIGVENVTYDWHLFHGTADSSGTELYQDGVSEATGGTSMSLPYGNAAEWKIGDYYQDAEERHFDGMIDEVRIANSVLSADWIAAEYSNQNAPTTFYSVGGGPDGTEYYVELTIDSGQISSTLTNFPVYVNLSDLPSTGFWDTVQNNGGDIRVTKSDGTTRCAVELVSIDASAQTGELHFLADSISSSVDTTFRIYFGTSTVGPLVQPGVETTYGRNAVWGDYGAVYHGDDTTDSTGNGNTLIAQGNAATGYTTNSKIGDAFNLDGTGDYLEASDSASLDLTGDVSLSYWLRLTAYQSSNFTAFVGKWDTASERSYATYGNNTSSTTDEIHFLDLSTDGGNNVGEGNETTNTINANSSFTHYVARFDLSGGVNGLELFSNGTVQSMAVTGTTPFASIHSGTAKFAIGEHFNSGSPLGRNPAGQFDEVRVRGSVLSSDWIFAEYTNQNTPTSFYTVGSQTAA